MRCNARKTLPQKTSQKVREYIKFLEFQKKAKQ